MSPIYEELNVNIQWLVDTCLEKGLITKNELFVEDSSGPDWDDDLAICLTKQIADMRKKLEAPKELDDDAQCSSDLSQYSELEDLETESDCGALSSFNTIGTAGEGRTAATSSFPTLDFGAEETGHIGLAKESPKLQLAQEAAPVARSSSLTNMSDALGGATLDSMDSNSESVYEDLGSFCLASTPKSGCSQVGPGMLQSAAVGPDVGGALESAGGCHRLVTPWKVTIRHSFLEVVSPIAPEPRRRCSSAPPQARAPGKALQILPDLKSKTGGCPLEPKTTNAGEPEATQQDRGRRADSPSSSSSSRSSSSCSSSSCLSSSCLSSSCSSSSSASSSSSSSDSEAMDDAERASAMAQEAIHQQGEPFRRLLLDTCQDAFEQAELLQDASWEQKRWEVAGVSFLACLYQRKLLPRRAAADVLTKAAAAISNDCRNEHAADILQRMLSVSGELLERRARWKFVVIKAREQLARLEAQPAPPVYQ